MPVTGENPGRYILKSEDYQGVRWRQGERLEQLFKERCDALRRARQDGGGLAVDGPAERLTYAELDRRANKLARFLVRRRGVRPGDRIGLLFDEAADGYAGMLAVLKARAVYVPLDAGFPQDRLSYIISDASVRMVLTSSRLGGLITGTETVCLDEAADRIARESDERIESVQAAETNDPTKWPVVFDRAAGSWLYDESGQPYLDFFTGASALNYGHNNPVLKQSLLDYLDADRVIHSLDMFTIAKAEFLTAFDEVILRPRGLDYKVQFPGPADTIAVEAALKLARKVTGRGQIAYFTHGFHGMTLAALSVTANSFHRGGAGLPLAHATPLPYDHHLNGAVPDFTWLDSLLEDSGSGLDLPAAVIVECVQGEGGINVASPAWLRGLADRCRRHGMLLIVDDVQMGCGRTGPFFSFEVAGIKPDIVCLSKSISGYGFPLALTLIRPDLDIWEPGEHTGTFRGIDPALVTGTTALRTYWGDHALEGKSMANGRRIHSALTDLACSVPAARVRGRGMAHGLEFEQPGLGVKVAATAFDLGLMVETAGPADKVVKLLPPLTVSQEELNHGLELLGQSVRKVAPLHEMSSAAAG